MGLCAEGDCPELNLTSDLQFDGSFSNITVPAGSSLNDVLTLMETYFNNTLLDLETVTYTLAEPNCIGLAAGDYNYQQVLTAVINELCSIAASVTNPTDTDNVDLVNIVETACFGDFAGTTATDLFNYILDKLCDLWFKVNILPNLDWNFGNETDFSPYFMLKEVITGLADKTEFVYQHTTVVTSPTLLNITVQPMKAVVEGYPVYRASTEVFALSPNKDIYFSLDKDGVITKTEQTIGDPAPSMTNKVYLYKIVTDGSGVTSYTEQFEASAFNTPTLSIPNGYITDVMIGLNEIKADKLVDQVTAGTKGHSSVITITYNAKGQITSCTSNLKITGIADGDTLVYDVGQAGFINTPLTNTNIANADLTFNNNRLHNLDGYAVLFQNGAFGINAAGSSANPAFSVSHDSAIYPTAVFENTGGFDAVVVNEGFVRLLTTAAPTYADEAAALAGGLVTGTIYKTATGELRIKL